MLFVFYEQLDEPSVRLLGQVRVQVCFLRSRPNSGDNPLDACAINYLLPRHFQLRGLSHIGGSFGNQADNGVVQTIDVSSYVVHGIAFWHGVLVRYFIEFRNQFPQGTTMVRLSILRARPGGRKSAIVRSIIVG